MACSFISMQTEIAEQSGLRCRHQQRRIFPPTLGGTRWNLVVIGDKGTFDERNIFLTRIDPQLQPFITNEYPFSVNFTNYPF